MVFTDLKVLWGNGTSKQKTKGGKNKLMNTAISIKVVHEQSGKVEYERERLLGIANKLMNFQSGSQQPFALVFDFSALLVDNLN